MARVVVVLVSSKRLACTRKSLAGYHWALLGRQLATRLHNLPDVVLQGSHPYAFVRSFSLDARIEETTANFCCVEIQGWQTERVLPLRFLDA